MAEPALVKPLSKRFVRLRVACFEGHWSTDMRDRQSVLPVLELLERAGSIRFFHRPVADREQLMKDLKAWAMQKRYADWEVGFIATHGEPEALHIGQTPIRLDDVAQALRGQLNEPDCVLRFLLDC